MLDNEEIILVCHTINMELTRLDNIKNNCKSIKAFNDIYEDHISAIKNIKRKLEKTIK